MECNQKKLLWLQRQVLKMFQIYQIVAELNMLDFTRPLRGEFWVEISVCGQELKLDGHPRPRGLVEWALNQLEEYTEFHKKKKINFSNEARK